MMTNMWWWMRMKFYWTIYDMLQLQHVYINYIYVLIFYRERERERERERRRKKKASMIVMRMMKNILNN
jgi:hypothetical protein